MRNLFFKNIHSPIQGNKGIICILTKNVNIRYLERRYYLVLLDINISVEDDTQVASLRGVLDVSTVDIFIQNLETELGCEKLNIDLEQLTFIDSTGIGALAQIIKKANSSNVNIRVTNISNSIFEVLDLLGLPEFFGRDIFTTKRN